MIQNMEDNTFLTPYTGVPCIYAAPPNGSCDVVLNFNIPSNNSNINIIIASNAFAFDITVSNITFTYSPLFHVSDKLLVNHGNTSIENLLTLNNGLTVSGGSVTGISPIVITLLI